jgi:HAMP domain-containing protein
MLLPQWSRSTGRKTGSGGNRARSSAHRSSRYSLAVPLARAYQALFWFMLALAGTFVVTIVMVDILLSVLVTRPVAEISEMANKVSMGPLNAPEYVHNSRDEIGSLSASFNRMRRSVQNAMRMLEEQG